MRLLLALFNLYVSFWKAWSMPAHPPTFGRPLHEVYDQEDDSEFDWPVAPKQQNRIPSTAIMRRFDPSRDWAEYAKSIEYHQFVTEAEEGR
jgi:hypothetical protein